MVGACFAASEISTLPVGERLGGLFFFVFSFEFITFLLPLDLLQLSFLTGLKVIWAESNRIDGCIDLAFLCQ